VTAPPPFSSDTTAASTAAERVLETFRSDGIAVARFDELFGEELWQEAVADITPFVAETDARAAELGRQDDGEARGKEKDEVIVRRFYAKGVDKHLYSSPRRGSGSPLPTRARHRQRLRRAADQADLRGQLVHGAAPGGDRARRVAALAPRPRGRPHREDVHLFQRRRRGGGPVRVHPRQRAGGKYGDVFPWGQGHRYPPPTSWRPRSTPTTG
jgi:hypothetical protein